MNPFYKNIALWLLIGIAIIFLFELVSSDRAKKLEEVAFSEFMQKVDRGEIKEISIRTGEQLLKGKDTNETEFKTYIIVDSFDSSLLEQLRSKGITVKVEPENKNPWYGYLLMWWPMLIFIGIWIFFMRQMQMGGNKALSFGKSRAKLLTEDHRKVTFKDVAGVDEAQEELQEIT